MYHSAFVDMTNSDVIIHIGCIIATCVKVVMKTPLTVVLCIVCNIGTSTLCAYCIPPHGWWGQPFRFERDCSNQNLIFVYGTWLMRSQTNSFVVCTLWCLTLKSAVLIYVPVLHDSVLSQHIDKGSKLIGSLVVEDPLISWFDCVDTWIVKRTLSIFG